MALADVQMIVQSLENAKQQQLQKAQLAQQHDQFIQDLQQRHEQMVNEQEVARANSKMNIAKLASTDPNFLASYAGATKTGTTGDPGYQSPNIGGQPLALNPSRDPNEYNTYNIPGIGDLNSPTMPTYIAQKAAEQLALSSAQELPQEKLKGVEAGYAAEAAAKLAEHQTQLAGLNNNSAYKIALMQSTDDLLKARMTKAQEDRKIDEDIRFHNITKTLDESKIAAQKSITDADNESRKYIAKLNLGMGDPNEQGSFANQLHNGTVSVYLGDKTLQDLQKELPFKGQDNVVSGDLLNMGGISLTNKQNVAVNTVSMMKNIVAKMDEIRGMTYAKQPLEFEKALKDLEALSSNLITTVDGTGGSRINKTLQDQAKAAYSMSRAPNMFNTNDRTRDNVIKTFRSYIDEQLNNLSPKQREAIKFHKGMNWLQTLDEQKKSGGKGSSNNANDTSKSVDDYFKRNPLQ